jgi:hypothetical protein
MIWQFEIFLVSHSILHDLWQDTRTRNHDSSVFSDFRIENPRSS